MMMDGLSSSGIRVAVSTNAQHIPAMTENRTISPVLIYRSAQKF
jgi:hypothetical protein